ncbi:hypothetical protein J6590_028509 [Homalodisca vitripennis]|nr:hypothetical protein J6590_028509 [Homalodisca vitripennis]
MPLALQLFAGPQTNLLSQTTNIALRALVLVYRQQMASRQAGSEPFDNSIVITVIPERKLLSEVTAFENVIRPRLALRSRYHGPAPRRPYLGAGGSVTVVGNPAPAVSDLSLPYMSPIAKLVDNCSSDMAPVRPDISSTRQ